MAQPSPAPRLFWRFGLGTQLFFALGLLSLVLIGVITAGLATLASVRTDIQTNFSVSAAASDAANDVQAATLLCRRYEKDLLLTMDDPAARAEYLALWQGAYARLQEAIEQFAALANSDDERQQAEVWRRDSATYHQAVLDVERAIAQGRVSTPQAANALLLPFKTPIRSLTDSAVAAAAHEHAELEEADQRLIGTTDWALRTLGGASLLALLFALLWNRWFARQLLRPIQQLREATRRFAQGDLAFRADVRRGDELGALAGSFHQMAEQIQRQQALEHEQRVLVQEQNAQLLALLELVRDLETPAIPLLDGVLLVPIVGHLDSRRIVTLQERVLDSVHTRRAHTVILDLTGLALIDTQVIYVLQQFVTAVRILGTRTIITGISPQVAMAVTQLGLSFGPVQITSHVQAGIAAAMHRGARPAGGAVL